LHRGIESSVLGPDSRSGRSLLIASVGWECTSPRGRKDRCRVSTGSRLILWSPGTLRFRLLVTCVILVAASATAGLVLKDRGVWHDRSMDTLRQRPQLHRRRSAQATSITATSRRHDFLFVVPVGRRTRSRLVPMFRHSLAFTLIVADKYKIGIARFGLNGVTRRLWLGRPSSCIRAGELELGVGSLGELGAMVGRELQLTASASTDIEEEKEGETGYDDKGQQKEEHDLASERVGKGLGRRSGGTVLSAVTCGTCALAYIFAIVSGLVVNRTKSRAIFESARLVITTSVVTDGSRPVRNHSSSYGIGQGDCLSALCTPFFGLYNCDLQRD
jgi:hypothetical protein